MTNFSRRIHRFVAAGGALVLALGFSARGVAEVGEVVWWELLSEDASTAVDFYGDLFGWQIDQHPSGNWIVAAAGVPFAGISQIRDELENEDESMWLIGFEVEDVNRSRRVAKRLGATRHESGVLEGIAEYAAVEDDQNAVFLLMRPERPLGGPAKPWVWAELWTHDIDKASRFYSKLFGFQRSVETLAGGTYRVFQVDDALRAGLVPIEERKVDPIWAPYLGVDDLEALLSKARGLGGKVLMSPSEEIAGGKVALLEDPTGGAFFVYQWQREGEP